MEAAPTGSPAAMSSARALGLSSSTVAPEESPLLMAQRLYAQGQWGPAEAAYESACAVLPKIEKIPCRHWGVLALTQTGVADDFWKASLRLDTLLSMTEPEDTYFADLLLTRSRLHLLQGHAELAARTWKLSAASASPALAVPLYHLCEDISKYDSSLVKECARVAPPQSALLQAKHTPTVPLESLRSSSSESVSSSSGAATESAAVASSGWVIQLGAFGVKENATLQLTHLKKQKIKARIVEKAGPNRILHVVVTEPFATKEAAQDYATQTLQPLKLDFQVVPAP